MCEVMAVSAALRSRSSSLRCIVSYSVGEYKCALCAGDKTMVVATTGLCL